MYAQYDYRHYSETDNTEAETSSSYYPFLQREDRGFVNVDFDCDFRFADADVAVSTGRVQDTWDQQLLPEVGTLVQEDLEKRQPKVNMNGGKTAELLERILL